MSVGASVSEQGGSPPLAHRQRTSITLAVVRGSPGPASPTTRNVSSEKRALWTTSPLTISPGIAGEVDHFTTRPESIGPGASPSLASCEPMSPGPHAQAKPARSAHRIRPCMSRDGSNRKATPKQTQSGEFMPTLGARNLPTVHDPYKAMVTEPQTQEAGTAFAVHDAAHAFVVLHIEGEERSRVLDLPDGVDVTFGRSRGATVTVESEKVSRMHARVKRTGDVIEVEDLGSRNGTRVNGEKIEGVVRVTNGDEISIGSILAVVGMTSGLRKTSPIAD